MNSEAATNEEKRQANLEEYQILDTPDDHCFNNLVAMAASVFQAPMAAISFMDRGRPWMKASFGVNRMEEPKDMSFSSMVVNGKEPLIVMAGEMNLRFYAGVPIVSAEGFVLGAFCILDQKPRQFEIHQLELLKRFALQAVALLEKYRYEKIIQKQKEVILENSKLSTLGQMTAEIIHEINNPLAINQALAEVLIAKTKKETHTNDQTAVIAEKMLRSAKRISQIIKGVKSFSLTAQQESPENVAVSSIIDNTLPFCVDRIRSASVDLRVEMVPANLVIQCREVQISQVLLNFINNAIDAISDLQERWIRIEVKDAGDQVEIRVTDSGCGIDSSVCEKLFDPFFTTKKKGEGTGLGLSISRNIVEAHRGSIQYAEVEGHTAFSICLPKCSSNEIGVQVIETIR